MDTGSVHIDDFFVRADVGISPYSIMNNCKYHLYKYFHAPALDIFSPACYDDEKTTDGKRMKIKNIRPADIPRDILTGIIIALVSIPISMGYAQVAGLPAVYGLYGSIFPILIFGLLSSSPQFIFGVDAAPAALVGAAVTAMGIESGSERAEAVVPLITFFVGFWLMVMFIFKAGRLVTYISTPVMGGFISGISTTIIFMQIPKLLGGTSGTGEIAELIRHIVTTCRSSFNGMSLLLGGVSLAVLLISKKLMPKLPMSVVVMAAGAVIGYSGFADEHGVAKLSPISRGLPAWELPAFDLDTVMDVLPVSFTVAIVIMAETLLASNSVANRNGYRIDNTREVLVYSLGNLAASFVGCCPVNGSVSRTSMGEQYGGRSQIMSITASFAMTAIMLFGTGFIQYLPVPVLTAIVISALLGAVEFHLIKRLFRQDRRELLIFLGAFFGVLIFGTVYGVMIGVTLSFVSVIIRTANPKRSFLGVIPGREGFHSLERNTWSIPLKNAVIYRFSGNLYFANIGIFTDDIEAALTADTHCVVVDSGAVCNIDITAADKIAALDKSLAAKGVSLYFASHIGALNDRFRQLGIGYLVETGRCRRTIPSALLDAGLAPPYVLTKADIDHSAALSAGNQRRLEFEWAFGENADEELEKYAERMLAGIDGDSAPDAQLRDMLHAEGDWKGMGELDQEELLVHLQTHIRDIAQRLGMTETEVEEAIERRRMKLAIRLGRSDPHALELIRSHTQRFEEALRERDPAVYESMMKYRREAIAKLSESDPEYSEILRGLYEQ